MDIYTPPGIVRVSPAAVSLAHDHAGSHIAKSQSPDDLPSFAWAVDYRLRQSDGVSWKASGPCVVLVGVSRADFPADAICTTGGLQYLIQIPSDIYERANERLIDRYDNELSKIILR